MVDLVVFSKNRAFQLEGLLRSVKENCPHFNQIYCLLKWTNKQYHLGYGRVPPEHRDVRFIADEGFYASTMALLKKVKGDQLCFMVDDNIVFDKVHYIPNEFKIISLRLGQNIKVQKQFKYKMSLDGHIYPTEWIMDKINRVQGFENPNKLEAYLQKYGKKAPEMEWFNTSKVVGIPCNKVSETSQCAAGHHHPYNTEVLNNLFLDGKRMDYNSMEFGEVTNVHKEIELKWV